MPRTALTVAQTAPDAFFTPTFQTVDNTNGNVINSVPKGTLVLNFKNTNAAARDVTIKAGVGGDTGPSWRAASDLAVTVPLTSGDRQIVLKDTAKYVQANGSINIDCTGANVTVSVLVV